jgi:hypothetical protein
MADFSSPSSSLQAPRGSASRRESLKSFEKTVRLFEKHPVQAFLVAAGNNSSLFISNRQPSSDQIHEPNDKPSLINHFAGQRIWGLYNHYHSKPLLCVNGTSSDRALTNDVKDFLNSLASHMVENGVGHICGGAETGSMGEGIRAWIKANKEKQRCC